MTSHSDERTGHASASRQGLNGHATAVPTAQLLLDSVVRGATELARSVDTPPRRIKLSYGQTSVEVEWPVQEAPATADGQSAPGRAPARPGTTAGPGGSGAAVDGGSGPHYLCAPTVGTFYHSPEPGAPAYVRVGDVVRCGQPVGVLEVMKMMSTIEADSAGRVVEVIAADAAPVEFQQRLIALEPLESPEPPDRRRPREPEPEG